MNVTSLVKALQTKISTATQYTSVYYVSKALEKLKLGNVKSVQTYDDLLAIDAISGDLVFVEDINRMYFKSTEIGPSKWINLIDSTFIAWAWGRNNEGQLGDATTINRSSPVSIIGGINDWIQLSAGGSHSLGLCSAFTSSTRSRRARPTVGSFDVGRNNIQCYDACCTSQQRRIGSVC